MNPTLKIETVKTSAGDEVSFCPERGGIITSIKLKGKELLYLDESTFRNIAEHVRGGVPILFPNSGPIESIKFPCLKQHGLARLSSKWSLGKKDKNGFTEELKADDDTKKFFPYDFKLSIDCKFEENGSFTLTQSVENLELEKEMPISMGLHPYFKVSDIAKKNIKFNFDGKNLTEDQFETWMKGGSVSIDNPKTRNGDASSEVSIPSMGTLEINASPEYKKIKIWSLPEKDFICIEPVMRDDGGLVNDPQNIKPKETFSANVNFSLKE
ncbi:MAG: hypothetical protein PHS95_01375 [Candidatus Pacebacteria bacterium]|nr:hypothetical protein [Candidatus Paceibacterota bacterium]